MPSSQPVARFRLRITAGEGVAVGPGKIALLEAIAETGSLTAAAKSLGMSYRRAWLLLDELNKSLREPAVISGKGGAHGGGSTLTEVGCELIQLYRRIEEHALKTNDGDLQRLTDLLVV